MEKQFLKQAIALSKLSVKENGFPVGAIIVKGGQIIGRGLSMAKINKDATNHAEISAIRNASKTLDSYELTDCELYSSLEPCLMCFSASYWARIKKVFYACGKDRLSKPYYEGSHNLKEINYKNNRKIEIVHIKELEDEALVIIQDWEQNKRL